MYAAAHPDKPGVIEDGNVITYAAFEARANQVAGALQQLGIKAGTKLVWCAENSTEVVLVVNAARKAGAVAVPLNYRLSSDEAAYVIDNSDATVVLFDVEQTDQLAPCVAQCPKITAWASFHCTADQSPTWAQHLTSIADGMPTTEVSPLEGTEESRRHDDLHVGHHGEAEGRAAPRWRQPGDRWRARADDRLRAVRHLPHDRAAVPLGPARVHGDRAADGRHDRRAAPLRRRGVAPARRRAQGDHDVLGADARPPHRRSPRGGARSTTTRR